MRAEFIRLTNESPVYINVNAIVAIHAVEDGRTLILLLGDSALTVDEPVDVILDLITRAPGDVGCEMGAKPGPHRSQS